MPRRAPGGGRGEADYDLAIVGSGGGAFAAAIYARERDACVVMIEQGTVAGTCVNIGCVPSEAMLRAGQVFERAGHNPHAGVPTFTEPVTLKDLVAQKHKARPPPGTRRRVNPTARSAGR